MLSPEILKNAHIDLAPNADGQFSSTDWSRILNEADKRWQDIRLEQPGADDKAWHEVVRQFHRDAYFGFAPIFRDKKSKRPRNLGFSLIFLMFNSMVGLKVAVLWFGQKYSNGDNPTDKWIFFAVLTVVVLNYGFFLWRNRRAED